jgi:hypothetical protein
MIQFTSRDDEMLRWLGVVRLADMETVRLALGAMHGSDRGVHLRKAQNWVARLIELGLVERGRPTHREGSIVWATAKAVGRQAPNLLGQTTRHDVAVANVSARYLLRGWEWARDRKAEGFLDHEVDGVAKRGSQVELIEVELTPKARSRYKGICDSHTDRLLHEGVSRIVYACTSDAARMVSREADKHVFRTERDRLVSFTGFDKLGRWIARDDALWYGQTEPQETALPVQLQGLEIFEGSAR